MNAIDTAPSDSASPDNSSLSIAFSTIYTLDILSVIVQYLPWSVVVQVVHWPTPAPLVVEAEKRRRIFTLLDRFIPYNVKNPILLEAFFDRLENCEGAIIGSLPRLLLLSGTDAEKTLPAPRDLNIATSNGSSEAIHDFFEALGYHCSTVAPAPHHSKSVVYVERYTKETDSEVSGLMRPRTSVLTYSLGIGRSCRRKQDKNA